MTASTLGERIKECRSSLGMTQGHLAIGSGLPQATISRIETGKTKELKAGAISGLSNALGVTVNFLLGEPGAERHRSDWRMSQRLPSGTKGLFRCPVLTWEQAVNPPESPLPMMGFDYGVVKFAGGLKVIAKNSDPGPQAVQGEYVYPDIEGKDLFALYIRASDDSMIPKFTEGDTIIISPHIDRASGDFVLVKRPNEKEAVLRSLQMNENGSLTLHALNQKYPPQTFTSRQGGIRIIGVVVKKWCTFKGVAPAQDAFDDLKESLVRMAKGEEEPRKLRSKYGWDIIPDA